MAHAADPDDMLVFIDGDAFPIAPMVPFLREQLDSYPLVAVRRDENNGDPQPHPSFCATTARFWLELPGDWRRGYKWKNRQGSRVTDVGGNMLGLLEEKGIDWYPLLRTNKVNPHPLQFGVYGDLIYHHGGGFRKTAGGRVSWMPHRDALRKGSVRGWLAGRLPRRGRLGYLRRRIDPVRRYRGARRAAHRDQRSGLRADQGRRPVLPAVDRAGAGRRAGRAADAVAGRFSEGRGSRCGGDRAKR